MPRKVERGEATLCIGMCLSFLMLIGACLYGIWTNDGRPVATALVLLVGFGVPSLINYLDWRDKRP